MKDNFNIRFIIANIFQNLEIIHAKMTEYKESFHEFEEFFREFFKQKISVKPILERDKSQMVMEGE